MRRRQVVGLGAAGLLIGPQDASAAPTAAEWLPLPDNDLRVVEGSALDFSDLVPTAPAGREGWSRPQGEAVVAKPGPGQRFSCTSFVFSPPNGGVPTGSEAAQMVLQLRRAGYAAVRFHFVDAHLMEGRSADFDFDRDKLDRLHRFMALLKANGIRWIVDGLTSDNGAYGDVQPHRFVNTSHRAKAEALIDEPGFQHWARVVDGIWGIRNPYTGLSSLSDPALWAVILVNEGSLAFGAAVGAGFPERIRKPFAAWLSTHYSNAAAWAAAWGTERTTRDVWTDSIEAPPDWRAVGKRAADFAQFVIALEQAGLRKMQSHVRSRGFQGLATAYSNWGFFGADVSRSAAAWVDMHAYHGEPSRHGEPGSQLLQASLLTTGARAVRELSNARQWDRPFTVTEYGQPFWHGRRYEMPLLTAAMAAHHGWISICQFAEWPVQFDFRDERASRRKAMFPYGLGGDPVARAAERLTAVLFTRGDVSASPNRIRVHLDADAVPSRNAGREQLPEAVSRLAFVTPIGLDFNPPPARTPPSELSIDLRSQPPAWVGRLQSALVSRNIDFGVGELEPLRSAGIISGSNGSDPQSGVFVSDTGEISLDFPRESATVTTVRTAVVMLGPAVAAGAAGPMSVSEVDSPALLAASSLDGRELRSTRRVLVWALTDARNTGMRFADAERKTLAELGRHPPQVRRLRATLRILNPALRGGVAWALGLDGRRRESLELQSFSDGVALHIDTAKLESGPCLYFEIAAA